MQSGQNVSFNQFSTSATVWVNSKSFLISKFSQIPGHFSARKMTVYDITVRELLFLNTFVRHEPNAYLSMVQTD